MVDMCEGESKCKWRVPLKNLSALNDHHFLIKDLSSFLFQVFLQFFLFCSLLHCLLYLLCNPVFSNVHHWPLHCMGFLITETATQGKQPLQRKKFYFFRLLSWTMQMASGIRNTCICHEGGTKTRSIDGGRKWRHIFNQYVQLGQQTVCDAQNESQHCTVRLMNFALLLPLPSVRPTTPPAALPSPLAASTQLHHRRPSHPFSIAVWTRFLTWLRH